jgi:hypothetical protein
LISLLQVFKTAQDGGRQEQALVEGQEGWKEEGVSENMIHAMRNVYLDAQSYFMETKSHLKIHH